MRDERAQRLAELAQRRSDEARFRVREAVRRLDRVGQPVTFAAVAEAGLRLPLLALPALLNEPGMTGG